jgi:hypothetical protein
MLKGSFFTFLTRGLVFGVVLLCFIIGEQSSVFGPQLVQEQEEQQLERHNPCPMQNKPPTRNIAKIPNPLKVKTVNIVAMINKIRPTTLQRCVRTFSLILQSLISIDIPLHKLGSTFI